MGMKKRMLSRITAGILSGLVLGASAIGTVPNMAYAEDMADTGSVEETEVDESDESDSSDVVEDVDDILFYTEGEIEEGEDSTEYISDGISFNIDYTGKGEKVGAVIGGQVLPQDPDEDKFRQVAREIGVNEEEYIRALHKVNVRTEESINASANLLGQVLNNFINSEYEKKYVKSIVVDLKSGVEKTSKIVEEITKCTQELKSLQNRQKILSLNANIEAARAGEHGKGFSVVAMEVGKISENSSIANEKIETLVQDISSVVNGMHDPKKFELLLRE